MRRITTHQLDAGKAYLAGVLSKQSDQTLVCSDKDLPQIILRNIKRSKRGRIGMTNEHRLAVIRAAIASLQQRRVVTHELVEGSGKVAITLRQPHETRHRRRTDRYRGVGGRGRRPGMALGV